MIFASDNGPDPLTGERFNHGLRGSKYEVYEGGIRVPLFVRWTGTLEPGRRRQLVHFVDLLPTIIQLCQIEPDAPNPLDGKSFAGVLRNSEKGDLDKDSTHVRFWQWNRGVPNYTHNAAVREGDFKLVRPFVTRGIRVEDSTMPPQLFNLSIDPTETRDLADEHPHLVSRLNARLSDWVNEVEQDRKR